MIWVDGFGHCKLALSINTATSSIAGERRGVRIVIPVAFGWEEEEEEEEEEEDVTCKRRESFRVLDDVDVRRGVDAERGVISVRSGDPSGDSAMMCETNNAPTKRTESRKRYNELITRS